MRRFESDRCRSETLRLLTLAEPATCSRHRDGALHHRPPSLDPQRRSGSTGACGARSSRAAPTNGTLQGCTKGTGGVFRRPWKTAPWFHAWARHGPSQLNTPASVCAPASGAGIGGCKTSDEEQRSLPSCRVFRRIAHSGACGAHNNGGRTQPPGVSLRGSAGNSVTSSLRACLGRCRDFRIRLMVLYRTPIFQSPENK